MSTTLPEGTRIVEGLAGSIMIGVFYPYRKSCDAYIRFNGEPFIHCLQCERDLYAGPYTLIRHVRSHDRRKKVQALP